MHCTEMLGSFVARRQMVALELKLTKKVTADRERAGPPKPRIVVGRAKLNEPRLPKMRSACVALKATMPHDESERLFREP